MRIGSKLADQQRPDIDFVRRIKAVLDNRDKQDRLRSLNLSRTIGFADNIQRLLLRCSCISRFEIAEAQQLGAVRAGEEPHRPGCLSRLLGPRFRNIRGELWGWREIWGQ